MAAQYISTGGMVGSSGTGSGGSVDVPYMVDIENGDIIYILVATRQSLPASVIHDISTPAGWKLEVKSLKKLGGSNNGYGALFSKKATGSEAGNVTISVSGGDSVLDQITGMMVNFRDISLSTEDISFKDRDSNSTITWDAVDVNGEGRTLAAFFYAITGGLDPDIDINTPSGYTKAVEDKAGPTITATIQLYVKEDVSTDGSISATAVVDDYTQEWFTIHVSIFHSGSRSFIVN